MALKTSLAVLADAVDVGAAWPLVRMGGTVAAISPAAYRVEGLSAFLRLGDCFEIGDGPLRSLAEVIRIERAAAVVKPFIDQRDVRIGSVARHIGRLPLAPAAGWKGRTINAIAEPIDGMGPLIPGDLPRDCNGSPPPPTQRKRVSEALRTGVKPINIFSPICFGQRIGIFAGSGVGKSTLLAMLTRVQGFDTIVVALVGERGREVRDFLEDTLPAADRQRTIAVVATGDESAMMRRRAAKTATTIAEHFRDAGDNVLIVVDSVTRFAHALRDVALAAGEPPVARGYTPSIFADLPKLLERSGPGLEGQGSITGIYSVLIDGDDHNDPVADAVRGILDGHIVLDRAIAEQGRYPAVNLRGSISQLANHVWTAEQRVLVAKLRAMITRFEETQDLRMMGGYRPGTDVELDKAIEIVPAIYEAMKQSPSDMPTTNAFKDLATFLSRNVEPGAGQRNAS